MTSVPMPTYTSKDNCQPQKFQNFTINNLEENAADSVSPHFDETAHSTEETISTPAQTSEVLSSEPTPHITSEQSSELSTHIPVMSSTSSDDVTFYADVTAAKDTTSNFDETIAVDTGKKPFPIYAILFLVALAVLVIDSLILALVFCGNNQKLAITTSL